MPSTIEVFVRSLDQLFNSMDPSPFREKALDPEAEEFILNNAREMGRATVPTLVIHLEASAGIPDEESTIRDAIRLHFTRRSQTSSAELRQLLRRGRKSLVIGLCFLAVAIIGSDLVVRFMEPRPLAEVLRESLVIGGWVAMWGPIEIFLYEWWPIRDRRRLLDRLSRMEVRIVYPGEHEGPGSQEYPPRITSAAAPGRPRGSVRRTALETTGRRR